MQNKEWWYPTAFQSWGEEEHAAIARVIASNRFTMGEEVEAFEEEFAGYHGMHHAIMVNSGSSANLLAISAIRNRHHGVSFGWNVPAIAWATTYAPIIQNGFKLSVVDCDDTWNAPPPQSYFGLICSVLGNPAESSEATIIEDNCESLGARDNNGRLCGTRGVLNTFSFFWSHQLSAIEGGMILTNDEGLATVCRMMRDHGMTRSVKKTDRFEDEYDFRLFGYNVRPLEMHAAIAREQLKKLNGFIKKRQTNLAYFTSCAAKQELPIAMQRLSGTPSPFGIAFTCASKEARSTLVEVLRAAGIDCRLPTGGSFLKHEYAKPWRNQSTPNADRIHDTGLFLGNAPFEIYDKIEVAIAIMRDVLR
jgi:CDP-6-deoxy-D-xylo-4-hexulose-3-dehydrase